MIRIRPKLKEKLMKVEEEREYWKKEVESRRKSTVLPKRNPNNLAGSIHPSKSAD